MMLYRGLWYIMDVTYSLFLATEEEIRHCLNFSTQHEKRKEEIERVTCNEDFLLYWIIATVDFGGSAPDLT